LDGDQLHVGHGDKVAEIGGVVERVRPARDIIPPLGGSQVFSYLI
jgi:hypothetical protein